MGAIAAVMAVMAVMEAIGAIVTLPILEKNVESDVKIIVAINT